MDSRHTSGLVLNPMSKIPGSILRTVGRSCAEFVSLGFVISITLFLFTQTVSYNQGENPNSKRWEFITSISSGLLDFHWWLPIAAFAGLHAALVVWLSVKEQPGVRIIAVVLSFAIFFASWWLTIQLYHWMPNIRPATPLPLITIASPILIIGLVRANKSKDT